MPQTSQNGARSFKEGDWNEEGEKGIVIRGRLITSELLGVAVADPATPVISEYGVVVTVAPVKIVSISSQSSYISGRDPGCSHYNSLSFFRVENRGHLE